MELLVQDNASDMEKRLALKRMKRMLATLSQNYWLIVFHIATIMATEDTSDDRNAITTVKQLFIKKLETSFTPTKEPFYIDEELLALKQQFTDLRYRTVRVLLDLAQRMHTIHDKADDKEAPNAVTLLWQKATPKKVELTKDKSLITQMNALWIQINAFNEEKASPAFLALAGAMATHIIEDDEAVLYKIYELLGIAGQ